MDEAILESILNRLTALERWRADSEIIESGPKNNFGASAAPTNNDDSADGYQVGSLWIDTTANTSYICEDSTEGAAVWDQID